MSYGNENGELFITKDNGATIQKIAKNAQLPCGAKILTTDDAKAIKSRLNQQIPAWGIVGLLDGKIDGSGYGNKISQGYGSECGQYFIVQA